MSKQKSVKKIVSNKWLTFAIFLGFSIAWALVVDKLFKLAFMPSFLFGSVMALPSVLQTFVTACILAPVAEEALFRVAPMKIMEDRKWSEKSIFYGMFIISMLFGLYHASDYYHMFVQGIVGFIFAVHYYINKSFWLNVLMHASYNFILIFLLS